MYDDLADRFFTAVTRGDLDALRRIYAPEARVWHNDDPPAEQTVDQNLRVLEWLAANLEDFRYEEVRRHAVDGGFVQQHVLRGRLGNGQTVEIPACMVVQVEDGRVVRLEEYLDSAQVEPIRSFAVAQAGPPGT